ncbi:hypothetical protein FNW25_03650 [Flavobacterium franklandianum]|uniref:hypothetical protein n=1 Tax=Flavobacterium franklandianum TaxID=2594430 RepID=UPI00119385D1|nr:hypothetical protein [Flavobacterium franklandianum]TRX28859.1 hypothetical protein FNW25_03650 [Flavobacterium franklandianum]
MCFQSSWSQETQKIREDFKPSSVNQQGKQYPQVNSEGRVRASILVPQYNRVQLDIGGTKYLPKLLTNGLLGKDV